MKSYEKFFTIEAIPTKLVMSDAYKICYNISNISYLRNWWMINQKIEFQDKISSFSILFKYMENDIIQVFMKNHRYFRDFGLMIWSSL